MPFIPGKDLSINKKVKNTEVKPSVQGFVPGRDLSINKDVTKQDIDNSIKTLQNKTNNVNLNDTTKPISPIIKPVSKNVEKLITQGNLNRSVERYSSMFDELTTNPLPSTPTKTSTLYGQGEEKRLEGTTPLPVDSKEAMSIEDLLYGQQFKQMFGTYDIKSGYLDKNQKLVNIDLNNPSNKEMYMMALKQADKVKKELYDTQFDPNKTTEEISEGITKLTAPIKEGFLEEKNKLEKDLYSSRINQNLLKNTLGRYKDCVGEGCKDNSVRMQEYENTLDRIIEYDKSIKSIQEKKADLDHRITSLDQKASIPYIINNTEAKTIRETPEKFLAQDNNDILFKASKLGYESSALTNPELKSALNSIFTQKGTNNQTLQEYLKDNSTKYIHPEYKERRITSDLNYGFNIDVIDFQEKTLSGLETLKALTDGNKKMYTKYAQDLSKYKLEAIAEFKAKGQQIDPKSLQEIDNQIQKYNTLANQQDKVKEKIEQVETENFKDYKNFKETTEQYERKAKEFSVQFDIVQPIIKPTVGGVKGVVNAVNNYALIAGNATGVLSKDEQVLKTYANFKNDANNIDNYVPKAIKDVQAFTTVRGKDGSIKWTKSINPRATFREGISTTIESFMLAAAGAEIGVATGVEALLSKSQFGLVRYFADKVGMLPAGQLLMHDEIFKQNFESYLRGDLDSLNAALTKTEREKFIETGTEMWWTPEYDLFKSLSKQPIKDFVLKQFLRQSIGKSMISPVTKSLIETITTNMIKTPVEESIEELVGNVANTPFDKSVERNNLRYKAEDRLTYEESLSTIMNTTLAMLPTMGMGSVKGIYRNTKSGLADFNSEIYQNPEQYLLLARQYLNTVDEKKLLAQFPDAKTKKEVIDKVEEYYNTVKLTQRDSLPYTPYLLNPTEQDEFYNLTHQLYDLSQISTPSEQTFDKINTLNEQREVLKKKALEFRDEFQEDPTKALSKHLPEFFALLDTESINIPVLESIIKKLDEYNEQFELTSAIFASKENPEKKLYEKDIKIVNEFKAKIQERIANVNTEAETIDSIEPTPEDKIQINDNVYDPGVVLYVPTSTEDTEPKTITILEQLPTGEIKILEDNEEKIVPQDYFKDRKLLTAEEFEVNKQVEISSENLTPMNVLVEDLETTSTETESTEEVVSDVKSKKADIERNEQGDFIPKKYTLNRKGENPAPNIPLSAISEESFGSELPSDVKQVKLLEIRGKNSLGQTVGEVWIQKEDGQSYNADVVFNDAELKALEQPKKETPTTEIITSNISFSTEETSNPTSDREEARKLEEDEEDRLAIEQLFTTTTSGQTQGSNGFNDPRVLSLQTFLNNVKNISQYELLVLTKDNARIYGLQDLIYPTPGGDDIKLVVVKRNGDNITFIGAKEQELKEGEITPNTVISTSMRTPSLTWKNDKQNYHTNTNSTEKTPEDFQNEHIQRKKSVIISVAKGNTVSYPISSITRGRPVEEAKEALPVSKSLGIQIPGRQIVVFPQKDAKGNFTIEHNKVSKRFPKGRPFVQIGQHLEFLENRKLDKEDIDNIVAILEQIDKNHNINTKKSLEQNVKLFNFLSKVLYLRVPEYTNKDKETITQDTPLGNNQIFFKKTKGGFTINFNMITDVGSRVSTISFDMTKGSKSRVDIEKALNAKLKNLFHNIDSKDMMKPFIEYYKEGGKTTERKWSSYQDYLISDTLPNGTKRDVATIPLKLKLNPSSETTPNKYGRMMVFKEINKEEYVDIPATLETSVSFKDIHNKAGSYQIISNLITANFSISDKGIVTINKIFDTKINKTDKILELIQKEVNEPSAFKKESYSFKILTPAIEVTTETEETKEEKKPLIALDNTPINQEYKIADETIYEVEDYKEAEKYLESVLSDVPLSQIEGLIDNIAWGQLKEKAILLSSIAKKGTIQHEAYEALQKHFLSPRQIKKLREEFRNRKGTFIDHQTKKKVNYSEATDFQIKEELADEYMRYHLSNGTIRWEGEYQKNSWFRKLYNLITNLFLTDIEGTFKNLSSGKYRKLRLKYNLNSPVKENKMADEETRNPLFYNDTMESVTALLFQFITDGGGALGDLLKSDVNIDNYYNQVHDFFKHIMSSPEEMKNFFTDPANHYAVTNNATHEEKNEKFFDVQRSMYYILDNWEDVVKANKSYLGKYKIEFEDEELEENNPNKENKDKNDQFVNALTINRKLNANMRVKLLIATLKDQYYIKGRVQTRPNSLFLPKLVDYNKTFIQLMYALAPATTYNEMMDLLKDTARIDAKFIPLLGKLKLEEQTVDKSTVELRNDFFIAFSNFKNTYFKILVNEDGSAVNFVINDQDGINKLKNEWYEKLKSNKKVTVKDGKYIFDLGTDKPNLRTLEEYAKFAKDKLGIDVRLAYTKYKDVDEINLFRALKSIVDYTIGKEREKETNIDLIITDSREFKAKFDELARIYNKYNPIYETTQHLSIDREIVQNITLPSLVTQLSKIFNSISSKAELIERLPHYAQTMLYSELFTPEGRTRGAITVGVTEGIEERESDNNDSSSKLSLSGRLALDFANGLNNIYSIIVPADTKNEWVITYPKSVVEFTNNTLTLEKFINYFKAEVAKAKLDSTLKQNTKQLGLFKYILSEKTLANIDLSEGIETILFKNKEAIERDTLRYFRERAKETENRLWNNNLIVPTEGKEDEYRILLTPEGSVSRGGIESNRFKDISKEQIEDLVYEEEVKYMINIFEQFNLFFLNPNEWKDPFKRIKQTTSGVQKVVYSAKYFNDFHNQNSNVAFIEEGLETPKESVELFPGDLGFVNHQEEFNVQVFLDPVVESAEYEALKEILGEEESTPYSELKEADAQAQAFLGGYAQIRRRANTWTDAEEAFKQYDDALCRSDMDLYPKDPKDKQRADALRAIDKKIIAKGNPFYTIQAINKVREEQGLNPLPLPNLNILKPAYNGITQKGNFEQHKYSVAPLIWSHIRYIDENTGELKFSNAKDFYIKHYTNQTTYITFESANKVGQEKDAEELYDDNGKPNLNIKHKVLNWEWFGIQVETITQKLATTLGTQLTKLGILNLMSNGVPKDFRKTNSHLSEEDLKSKWDSLTEKVKRTTSKHYDLVRKNFEILSAMETKAINQFYKEFGGEVTVDPNTNKKVLTFTDYSKFEEKIQRELTNRDKPLNVKSLVRTNDKGQFILPFDTIISGTDTVENIINSLINKAILTPKIFGGQFPQVASTLFERNPRKKNPKTDKLYSGDLQFYKNEDGKRIMQIKLPWRYKELLGLENFDISKIDTELLKGVGFRIPTQALNSVEHFEIVGFLDPSYGDAVMVPSEIVGKAGSDFDIDKLNLYLYNHKFNKQTGKLEKIEFSSGTQDKDVEERYREYVKSKTYANLEKIEDNEEFEIIKKEYFTPIYSKLNSILNNKLKGFEENKATIIAFKETINLVKTLQHKGVGNNIFKLLTDKNNNIYERQDNLENYITTLNSLSISDQKIVSNILVQYGEYLSLTNETFKIKKLLKTAMKETKGYKEFKNKFDEALQDSFADFIINNDLASVSLEDFKELSIYEQNSKKALDNYYIDNLREILQLEDNFKQLVKPNDASELENEANDIKELKEKNQKSKPYPISILSRLHNIVKRYSFLVGKEGVGIAASNQTLNAISQTVVSNINVGFSFLFNTNTPVNEDNTIYSLSQEFNTEEKPISDLISMFLDAFVDIANKPYIFDANGNLTTAGTYIAGLRLGIPLSTLVRFFNQPIIIDYVNLLIQNQGALVKLNKRTPKTKSEIVDQLKDKYNLPLNEKGNILTLDRENYTNQELEEFITEREKATDFAINQGTLLVQFRQLEQVAQDILTLSQGVNVDTSLDRSFDSTRVKNAKLLDALQSSLGKTMSQIYNTTHIGNIYEIKNTILKAFSELYFSENPIVRPYLNKLMNSVIQSKKSTDDVEKELKTIRKDLVTYLLHTLPLTYGPLINQTISSYYPELFSKKDTNIANTIRQAQELHKGSSMFLSNIIGVDPIFLNKNDKNYQVRLLRKPENSNESNQMTADLHNLSLKATTENLAKSIIIGAIAQNGVSNTPNSYNNLIPANAIEDIMTQVLEQFEKLSPALQQQYMEDFVDNYYQTKWYDNSLVPIYKAPIDSNTGFPKNIYREQIVTSTTKKDNDGNFIKAPVFIIQIGSSSNITQKPYIKTSKVGINPTTGKQYTKNERDQMVKRKDFSFIEITLYKRLDSFNPNTQEKDVPLVATKNNKGFLVTYFPVKKYGNRETTEYYNTKTEYRPSYVNNEDLTKVTLNPNSGDLVLSSIKDSQEIIWDSEQDARFNFKSQDFLVSLQNMLDRLKNQQQQELPFVEEKTFSQVKDNNIKIISEPYGVVTTETNPSESKTQEFVNIIQPQIKKQAYKENNAATANDMFMYGLRWTRKGKAKAPINNRSYANGGKETTNALSKDGYVYDTLDQNGKPLAPLSELQPIISEIEKSLGIDMSHYDAVIGNIYLPGQNIATHRDTTESLSARNYPVIVYTIGNNSGISVYENENNPGKASFASDKKITIPTKNGSIYTFGMDGKGRFEVAHDTPKNIKRDVKFPSITMPDGKVITNYTITLTFRRAADLDENIPITPKKLPITQEVIEQPINKEIKPNEIYSQLGNKTQSESVVLPKDLGLTYNSKTFWSEFVPEFKAYNGDQIIIAYRGNRQKTFAENFKSNGVVKRPVTIGNPFDWQTETGSRKEQGIKSTKKFIDWLITGNNYGEANATEQYRNLIIDNIKNGELKGRPIGYYEEKGYATHATALDYLINKYDWNNQNQPTDIKPKIEIVNRYSDSEVKANPDKIYVFGDNIDRKGTGGQASIRNNSNAFGIATKAHPTNNEDAFMSDKDLESNKKVIDSDIQKILNQNKSLVFPKDGLGTGLAKLKEKAPQTYQYLKEQLLEKFGFNNDIGELTQEQPIVEENKPNIVDNGIEEGNVFTAKIDQFAYTLNTISGQVTHNSKTGDKIETNETQIGKVYKEYAVVNNYETKEFNKQNYAKVFGKIINIKTGSIVIQPQIINLFNNNNIKEIKISENIVLNKGQKEALEKFTKFLDKGENKFFLLKGRAGTGKTTIASTMMQVAKEKGYRIFATAISDAATTNLSVLSKNTPGSNIEIYNFAAMYGLVPQYDDDGTMTGFDFPSENSQVESEPKITNSYKTILIFDESSMVSLDTLSKIQKLTPNITILYMGDNAQIMPIGDTKISTVFSLEDQHELTEVMRQKEDSPILDIASNIAKEIDVYDNTEELKLSPILDKIYTDFNRTKNSGTIVTNSGEEFINEAVSDFKKYGNKQTLVITGNNNNVASLNKKIREKIVSSEEQFVPGERLMTYSKYSKYLGKNVPKLEIFNSSVINILSVTPSNVEGVPTNNLSVEYVDQQGRTKQTYMNVIHKNNVEDIKQFYDNKKKLNAEYKRTKDRSILDKLNAYSQTVLVDYAYAMTAHKAQGQTVRNTYVVPTYRGFSEIESRRMFYTSITRPTDKLVIFDKDAKDSNTVNKFSENTKTQSDITDEDLGLNTNLSQKDAKC